MRPLWIVAIIVCGAFALATVADVECGGAKCGFRVAPVEATRASRLSRRVVAWTRPLW